ncbi:MAG: 4-hydroxy-tetrahydrodipicolinate reductase [Armatimonadetes bacterium]|nr:4-hydroxy-tetrahydrodipicolinate reductase [Armatimonadota bacterium]
MIAVAVSGAAGRMGREVVGAVLGEPDMNLVAALDTRMTGADAGVLAGVEPCGVAVSDWNELSLAALGVEVLVDFTVPSTAAENALRALRDGVSPVVGTTGITQPDLERIASEATSRNVGAVVAPNFAIGAVLMMRFAEMAARYMPAVEIIEMHHPAKLDAPSGTAKLTAARVAEAIGMADPSALPIHSVRLPGLVAHQEVIFGALGQTLSIRHDSLDRKSFMPGVLVAIRRVRSLSGLVTGLDALLDG